MCGSVPGLTTASKSSSLGDVPTNAASLCFAVDESEHNPDDLFARAQSAEEAGDIAEAERLYRILMKSDPTDASAPFNLGNMLRANGRNVEAEAALRAATRVDPNYAPRLGTILATCWTSRDAPKPPSNACAKRCGSRLTTQMRCSTSRCCYNEKTNTRRPQITGAAISPAIANRNGRREPADH